MSIDSMQGGCLCGAVRYQTSAAPFAINYCHCESFRKHNGAPVVTLAGYQADNVTFSGEKRKTYESSPGATKAFCGHCGTPLTWEGDGDELGQIIELHISTFDKPELMVPTSHAFEPERLPWFEIADDLPRYEGILGKESAVAKRTCQIRLTVSDAAIFPQAAHLNDGEYQYGQSGSIDEYGTDGGKGLFGS